MVQNLRAYSILHVATIKWIIIMCMQENIELSSMSQRPRLSSSMSGDFFASYNDNAVTRKMKKIPRGGKRLAPYCSGVAFTTPWHPMATGLNRIRYQSDYKTALKKKPKAPL